MPSKNGFGNTRKKSPTMKYGAGKNPIKFMNLGDIQNAATSMMPTNLSGWKTSGKDSKNMRGVTPGKGGTFPNDSQREKNCY